MSTRRYRFALSLGLLIVLVLIADRSSAQGKPASLPVATSTPILTMPVQSDVPNATCASLANWQCMETRAGLSLCRANNICVVKVDLNQSTLRPKVVVVPNGGTAWLSSMASGAGAYAPINGDYFSGCPDTTPPLNCGEGLTYIDGTDYTDYTGSEWQNRRSLGFNDNYDPNIGWPGEQGGNHRQLLAAGPQVSFNGEYRWRCWYSGSNTDGNCTCSNDTVVINDELFGCSANNWWSRPQTMVGYSSDGNTLYLAVSEPGYNKTPRDMHDVLWVQGARNTLKMDGGGSTGMYFNDGGYSFAWDGGRAVANAWVIVPNSSPPPTPTPDCNPNADQIALYVDANYGGQCTTKGVGDYTNPGAIGLPNDAISSIKVGGNVKATLCRDDNYGGVCEVFTTDDANLGDNGLGDNQVSSVKVESRGCTAAADQIALFADTSFGGACVTLGPGDYPNPGTLGAVGNDNAESVKVGGNVQAILCEYDNYQGQCDTLLSDDANLSDNPIGSNRVSSARVQARPAPQPDLQPYAPTGYPTPVVPSSIAGTQSANTLYAGKDAYFDWHFINSGSAAATADFHVELWVDNIRYVRYPHSNFAAGWTGGFDDWREVVSSSGWHTVKLIVDPDNTIAESNEANNIWEGQFQWQPVTGWWGEYFNNTTLTGAPALVRDDANINFDWGDAAPGPGVTADQFSVRWTRALNFAASRYAFSLGHDDGARLWLDNSSVIDQWSTCCRTDTASVWLTSGLHTLRVEMFDSGGAANVQLTWRDQLPYKVYLPVLRR